MQAPFVLELRGPEAAAGEVPLVAVLRGRPGGRFPIDLTLVLPPGATLQAGQREEQVVLTRERPVLERRYLVQVTAPLREPVRLRAQLRDPALGAFAERSWPAPAPAAPAPAPGPGPAVGRLPVGTPVPVAP